MSEQPQKAPDVIGNDWRTWGRRLVQHLSQTRSALVQQNGEENAADDATLMWDRVNLYPIISRSGAFREIILKNAIPASSVGVAGDKAGLISWDASYIYVCTAAHNGSAHIWKRITLTGGSW